jgi:intein-encoded DNA endonuclease-like protein
MKTKAHVNILFVCENEKDVMDLKDGMFSVGFRDGSITSRESKYQMHVELRKVPFDQASKLRDFLAERGHYES